MFVFDPQRTRCCLLIICFVFWCFAEQDKLRYAEEMRKYMASKAAQEYALSKQETTKIRGSTTHRFIDELESHDFPLVGLRDPKSRAMNAVVEAEIEQLKKDSLAHGRCNIVGWLLAAVALTPCPGSPSFLFALQAAAVLWLARTWFAR